MDSTSTSAQPVPVTPTPPALQPPVRSVVQHFICNVLNILVLLGSVLVIAALSFEVFHDSQKLYSRLYMKIQLWVCIVFLVDFFYRFYISRRKGRFVWHNFIFFLVAIPYLHLLPYLHLNLSQEAYYFLRLMPLVRGGYGLAITVGWITRSNLTNLLVSYVLIILSLTYFASLVFFTLEHPINPAVTSYGEALWWAFMNVTTVGSNIFAKTATGAVLSVLLAASGMMLFPIFTVYITSRFQAMGARKNSGDLP